MDYKVIIGIKKYSNAEFKNFILYKKMIQVVAALFGFHSTGSNKSWVQTCLITNSLTNNLNKDDVQDMMSQLSRAWLLKSLSLPCREKMSVMKPMLFLVIKDSQKRSKKVRKGRRC